MKKMTREARRREARIKRRTEREEYEREVFDYLPPDRFNGDVLVF